MGKISILNPEQKALLSELSRDEFISNNFYFTGGTALSEFYIQHRKSEDLDFFSEQKYDTQVILQTITQLAKTYRFTFTSRFVPPVSIFILKYPDGIEQKVNFSYYPYKRLEINSQRHYNFAIDSIFDIAVNKLLAVNQRQVAKDFVDLYFLFRQFTFWDLRDGVLKKFHIDLEPLLVAADFLAVEDFEYLPKMIKPLTLKDLQEFYREKAKQLGRMTVK